MRQEREANGRATKTTFCVVDAQSIKTTETAQQSGYDAGKHGRGIKRHIAVDSEGLPHAIEVTTADVNDRNGALLMFLLHQETLSEGGNVLVDGAYNGERFDRLTWDILGAKVEVVKRSELHKFSMTVAMSIPPVASLPKASTFSSST